LKLVLPLKIPFGYARKRSTPRPAALNSTASKALIVEGAMELKEEARL
jgi:hypothetical protein